MKLPVCVALLAAGAVAQGVAHVNDAVSPGTLGDTLLSLDEAIRIVNTALPLSSLSAQERAQITGGGVPIDVEIDAAVTPTIALNADLTPFDGPAAGVDVSLRGVGSPRPALDGTGRAYVLAVRTNHATVSGLAIRGDGDGIRANTDASFLAGRLTQLLDLEFTGFQRALVLTTSGPTQMDPVMLRHSTFRDLATAIDIDDRSQSLPAMCHVEHVTFDNVALGVNMFTAGDGQMTMCRMWRSKMAESARLGVVRRDPAANKRSMLMLVACDIETTDDAVDAEGTALVETALHVHHSLIRPAQGKNAFVVGPRDARIDFHISENVVHGDVDIVEGRLNRRLWAWNNIFRDGTLTVDNQGTPTSFRWNRFERCTVRALPGNVGQMKHQSSEFFASAIDGQSIVGDVLLENCYLDGTTTSGSVSQQSPAPSPWLAETWASTDRPAIGTHVDLTMALPAGMLGVWQLGVSNPRLLLTLEPWREYAFRAPVLYLPGVYAIRSTLRLPVPMNTELVGAEIYCTAVTGPFVGQTHVPPLNFPRGVHLTITR